MSDPDLILIDGRIATGDPARPEAEAAAIADGRIAAVGDTADILALRGPASEVIGLNRRRVVPGLNDSHIHLIRGGLSYNMELRWEGVPTLADALGLLAEQAARTPPPQWVRVVGGWSEFQFAERRMPTLDEINAAAPDTPAFVLHLYDRALLNRAALEVLGFDRLTPDPPGGMIARDARGNPTGLLLARPSAMILYTALGRGPRLPVADQINSTRHFMRELNRLGVTSVIDAGGGGQNYPDDYEVIRRLHDAEQLTVRIAYNLFAQAAGRELADYERWLSLTAPGAGDAFLRMNGAGENLTWAAADFENFLEPRPELAAAMEEDLTAIVERLAASGWPFRIHATYDETIDRFLGVFEKVAGGGAFPTRFTIDHAETVSERNIERIAALGGGIAIQHRMAFQGEYFVARYGVRAAEATPPVARMLAAGLPVGGGTDATRVASYNPWVCLSWLTEGKTLGGMLLTPPRNRLDRRTALDVWTRGSARFSGEEKRKGRLSPGQYADLAVLSDDYLSVPGDMIADIESVLTMVGGRIVYAAAEFRHRDPPLPPPSPAWSPVGRFGGAWRRRDAAPAAPLPRLASACALHGPHRHADAGFWGAGGCSCFAF